MPKLSRRTNRAEATSGGTPALAVAATGPVISVVSPASTGVVNLTAVGTLDWATWPNGVFTHKAGGNKITNVTRVGTGTFGTWADNRIALSWSDGTPTANANGSQGLIYCNGQGNSGWSFRAPADTTTRKLHVLCGGSNGATFRIRADLSDNSFAAPIITKTDSSPNGYTLIEYIITYRAAGPGQNIKITLTHTLTSYQSVDLEAAWLTLDTTGGGGGSGGGGIPYPAALTNAGITGATMTFHDEFDGPLSISYNNPSTTWKIEAFNGAYQLGDAGDTYDPANGYNAYSISNSILSIKMWKDANGQWISGNMQTVAPDQSGFSQRYGYYEIRCKMPSGPGVWPAFWLSGIAKSADPSANDYLEIDVFEFYGYEQNAFMSSFGQWSDEGVLGAGESIRVYSPDGSAFPDRFHTFGVLWEPHKLTFYLDDQIVATEYPPDTIPTKDCIIITSALGSGFPTDQTEDPNFFQIDWVRAWRLP